MKTLILHEFKCKECHEFILLERDKEPDYCPYCGETNVDYAPGKIEPVLFYETRS